MNDKSTPESEPKKLTRADLKEAYIEWFCGEQPADPDFSGMADDPAYQREAVEMAEGLPPMGSLTCLTDPAALIAADTSTVIVAEIKNRFEKELDRHLSGNACDRTVQAALSDEIVALKAELAASREQVEKLKQYSRHRDGCQVVFSAHPCICGLRSALAATEPKEPGK